MLDSERDEALERLEIEMLKVSGSINSIHALAADTRKMVWELKAVAKPHVQNQTLATGGVLAVLANQLIPELSGSLHGAAAQSPTGLLVTLGVLVASMVIAKRQAQASEGMQKNLLYVPLKSEPPKARPLPSEPPEAPNPRDTAH